MSVRKVTKRTSEVYTIKSDEHDDTIFLYVDDYTPSQAKIIIEVFGDVWSYYWGSMADMGWKKFFCGCDNDYLLHKFLTPQRREEIDIDRIKRNAQLPEWVNYPSELNDIDISARMVEHYGYDWYTELPTRNTAEYYYLSKIIDTVKEALQQL